MSLSPMPSSPESPSIAQAYDAVPYPGLAVARSQPDFLELVARLRGLQPAPAATARVLELGCAAGQNLLPLAERYPNAQFVGIDVSGRQIDSARRVAAELALTNVEFVHQDLLEFQAGEAPFDYIIAQGVYSWVAAPVRDRLLAICQEQLAPQGVAFISYKTYPGWQLHDVFRAMMLYNSRRATTPGELLEISRATLRFFQDCFDEKRALDTLMQEELAPLLQLADPYLWHDHLASISHPVLFKHFMQHASRHELQLLGEATLGVRPTDQLDAETEHHLAALTTDPIQQDQLRDVIRNRAVRQALLCRTTAQLQGVFETERLTGLYLSAALQPESPPIDLLGEGVTQFATAAGGRVGTPVPLAKAALAHLGEIWPASLPLEGLVDAASQRLQSAGAKAPEPVDVQRLKDNLLQCIVGQVVHASCAANAFVAQISERPVGSPFARWQASRSEILTSRRHHAVRFEAFDRYVLSLLDGTRDTAAILDELIAANERGQLVVANPQQTTLGPDDIRRAFVEALPEALERLKFHAMLIG